MQTPQRFRKDLPDDPLGNHAASQVRLPGNRTNRLLVVVVGDDGLSDGSRGT